MLEKLVNSKSIFNTFINLYYRWGDEREYEDFNDYVSVMRKVVEDVIGSVNSIKGTKRPFGVCFKKDNKEYKLFLKFKGRYANLAASCI